MKKLPIAIIVVLLLIIGYLLLTKPAVAPVVEPEATEAVGTSETQNTTGGEGSSALTAEENIVVNTDSLGDGQQKMLKTFGVEGDIEITPAMIACAEEKIGQERVAEIVDGATPSFMEGVSLASCY